MKDRSILTAKDRRHVKEIVREELRQFGDDLMRRVRKEWGKGKAQQ